jgi:hypothetical protein
MPSAPKTPPILSYFTPPHRPAVVCRFVAWVMLVGVALLGTLAWVPFLRPLELGPAGHVRYLAFLGGWVVLGVVATGFLWLLRTTPRDAIRLKPARSIAWVIGGTIAVQVSGWFLFPVLSADLFRYRADAYLAAAAFSPYRTSPLEARLVRDEGDRFSRQPESLTSVRHGELRSIYPPAAQAWFRVAHAFSGIVPEEIPWAASLSALGPVRGPAWASGRALAEADTGHAVTFRAGASAFIVIATALIVTALAARDQSPWLAVPFAWNPLTVIECAGQGHVDALGVMFLAAAMACACFGRLLPATLAIALAAGVKPHVTALLPVLVMLAWCETTGDRRARFRRAATIGAAGAAALLAVYAPLWLSPANWQGWRETVAVYAMSWEANGSVYELITAPFRDGSGESLEHAKTAARVLGGVGAFVTLYLCVRSRLPLADAAYWLGLIPLLLAPVVYPWYLLWPLAAVPLLQGTGGWTAVVWAATSGLSYLMKIQPTWRMPPAAAGAEYLPVYAALAYELYRLCRSRAPAGTPNGAITAPAC